MADASCLGHKVSYDTIQEILVTVDHISEILTGSHLVLFLHWCDSEKQITNKLSFFFSNNSVKILGAIVFNKPRLSAITL